MSGVERSCVACGGGETSGSGHRRQRQRGSSISKREWEVAELAASEVTAVDWWDGGGSRKTSQAQLSASLKLEAAGGLYPAWG